MIEEEDGLHVCINQFKYCKYCRHIPEFERLELMHIASERCNEHMNRLQH